MDLHVRIALQEVDREKRRLISGGLFLAIGGTSMLLGIAGDRGGFGVVDSAAVVSSPDAGSTRSGRDQPCSGGFHPACGGAYSQGTFSSPDAGGFESNTSCPSRARLSQRMA